ncbi:DUF695 domain-containing protein [Paenibacillus methanolicus]|uniref:Regulator of ribonuclease activity B n=1 Tax=Paenibacillus methanolicus TaxID=582686 RepID=A0A5S5C0A6_9BACL|nr:DUF695 domain-containing protein [Paenibacillus methanolicus]TYP72038.1 regulator of ribonuclease activity B [Paenibacillus methanolicus]
MSDNWDTYFTYLEDKPASFLLDLEPWSDGANEELDRLYRLRVILKEPTDNGLTNQDEASLLNGIEDSIHDSLDEGYLFVGRLTTNGRRDFFYYANAEDGSEIERLAVRFLEGYRFDLERLEEDKPRSFYYESIYPNKANRHRMTNRHIVDKLKQLGDQLAKPRDVNHWLYFNSAASRNQFKARVQQDGFQIVDQNDRENKYALKIARAEVMELLAIGDVTDYLVRTT